MYIIFAKESCPYCKMATQLLEEKNLSFKIINFLQDQEHILSEIKDIHNWKTVPMVFLKEGGDVTLVGGYTDLSDSLKDG